jgi:hypothetical protein
VVRFECGEALKASTVEKIQSALEKAGVIFVDANDGGPGVRLSKGLDYFPAQNSTPLAFGENHPVGGKLRDRTELNLTSAAAVDSFL